MTPTKHNAAALVTQTPQALAEMDFVAAHHVGRLPVLFDHAPLTVITVLREPVARMLSFIRHAVSGGLWFVERSPDSPALEIDEVIENEEFLEFAKSHSYVSEFGTDDIAVRRLDLKALPSISREEQLTAAQAALKTTHVLLDNRLNLDAAALFRWLGAREPIEPLQRANQSMSDLAYSPRARNRVAELFADDIELYDGAVRRGPLDFPIAQPDPPTSVLSLGFERPLSAGRGWSGRVPQEQYVRFGRYADVRGAEIDIDLDDVSEIKISFLVWCRVAGAIFHLQTWLDDERLATKVVQVHPSDHHLARFVAHHPLDGTKRRATLRFTLDPEFLAGVDLSQHHFRDYGRDLICFFYFIEVSGRRG